MQLQVRALKLKDARFDNLAQQQDWDYDQITSHAARRDDWISFDSVSYNPSDDCVYCGIANFSNDIAYRYRRDSGKFESLNYRKIADPYDAKFHRALELDDDGIFWAATALLHDVDRFKEAPGGAIIRIDTKTGKMEKVCIPVPHIYIQSLVLDKKRRLLHGITFTPEMLFTYNIETKEVINHGIIGSGIETGQTEKPALDENGTLWCTWGVTRSFMYDTGPRPIRLLSLDPDTNKLTHYKHGVPLLGPGDNGRMDNFLTGRDGFLYLGSHAGGLYRLDPKTAEVKYLGKPAPGKRMAGMKYGPDGMIYLATGLSPSHIVRFDPKKDTFEVLGPIRDEKAGQDAYQIHDMCIAKDGTIYAGENDNFARSGYLWECRVREA